MANNTYAPTLDETLKPELLVAARTLLGYSQEEAATVCDIGVSTLRRLENQQRGQMISCSSTVYEKIKDALRQEGVAFFQDTTSHETRRTIVLYNWEDRVLAGIDG